MLLLVYSQKTGNRVYPAKPHKTAAAEMLILFSTVEISGTNTKLNAVLVKMQSLKLICVQTLPLLLVPQELAEPLA